MPSGATLSPLSCPSSLRKYVTVTFLNGTTITIPAEGKTRVCDIEAQVINYLQRLGMRDTDLFGLALQNDDEFLFVDGDNKLNKYASRQWKTASNGLDNVGNPLLKFEFRVKYYVDSHLLIRDHVSRLHYYMQLRENFLTYGHVLQEELALILASLALQADLGDYDAERHRGQYFEPSVYFPSKLLDQVGVSYFIDHINGYHRQHRGLQAAAAQAQFIREASQTEAPHNIHLYRLRRKKHDPSTQIALSICDKGIGIYEEDHCLRPASRKLVQSFPWSNIEDLSFDKKKFEIRAPCYPGKLTFYTSSDEKSKLLLHLCRLTHQFSRNLRMRSSDYLRTSGHDRKPSRDNSFIYHDSSYQDLSRDASISSSLGGYLGLDGVAVQRISICSNSSSDVTLGVGSDRILSVESSQDCGLEPNTAHNVQAGGMSISRSHSIASPIRTESTDLDNVPACDLQYTPLGSPETNPTSWELISGCGDNSGFGRSGSIQSSSSQHSVSTVRSRYSLVPSRHRHELALGAQLADLSLAPDLPDLADLPSMAANMSSRGDDVSDHVHSTTHNCCSTCCDDTNSIGSDDEDGDDNCERDACRCGSCNVCLLQNHEDGLSESEKALQIDYESSGSRQMFQSNSVFEEDDDSVMAQPDLDVSVSSTYNFSEEDFLQLDNNDDYVEFYKGGLRYSESLHPHSGMQQLVDEVDGSSIAETSLEFDNKSCNVVGIQSKKSQRSSPVEEEQSLDYSVESAQASLAASYPINKEMLAWALLMNSQNQANQKLFAQPAPVSMSKVITTTPPVNIASSRYNAGTTSPDAKNNTTSMLQRLINSSESSINEAAVANAFEAPAKFITSKPRITVLKAHTQLAATTAPSFSSVPLSRAKIHTLPQVQTRPKADAVQSLQRVALPDPRPLGLPPPYSSTEEVLHPCANHFINAQISQVPVIRANNYLDVHASSNRERLRTHQEQFPAKSPRSLYLKNQKKKLNQQTIQDKHKYEQFHQQLLSDTVYQPAAYAQGVGVPLLPSPTYTGCNHPNRHQQQMFDQRMSYLHQQNKVPQPYLLQQQQCCQAQNKTLHDLGHSHQSIMYQPQFRNFFQNPPPPTPHPGFGIGVCPGNQSLQMSSELLSPTYQCVSDPGPCTIPQSQIAHHQSNQQSSPLSTVYTKQVTLSQIEQYKAQLNSDEDYVIYPHKDPAISRQEYMDAKQSQVIATQAQKHHDQQLHSNCSVSSMGYTQMPPPYRSTKSSPLYRSTPNVGGSVGAGGILSSYPSYQSLASQGSTHQPGSSSGYSSMARGRYFSQQSLASSFSSVPSAYSASTQSLTGSFDPYADPPSLPNSPPAVMRVRSDESILSSSALTETDTHCGSLPPTNAPSRPPPPYRPKEVLDDCRSRTINGSGSRMPVRSRSRHSRVTLQQVRECGTQLDVPLLTALCSDASLLAQKGRPTSKSPKRRKSAKSASCAADSPSATAVPRPKVSTGTESAVMSGGSGRYSLPGVYTTNQVLGPHVSAQSSANNSNGVHRHPRESKPPVVKPLLPQPSTLLSEEGARRVKR